MAKTAKKELSFNEFIKKNFGQNVLKSGKDLIDRPRKILKTVLSLDIALNGGIPEGIITLISGKPKVGKTTLVLHILKNAIDENRPVFYVDIEKRCTAALLSTIPGLNKEKLHIISAEQDKILSAEDWLQIIERTIKDHPNAVVIVDSLAVLSTLAEHSELVGENRDMAGVPKLIASFIRKNIQVVDNNNTSLIFISQYQTNRDPASRKKYIEKGGLGIQYACSVWINVDYVKLWPKNTEMDAPMGHDIYLKIMSSALGSPFMPCCIPLRFGKGIDVYMDLINHCENLGIIEKSGSWYNISGNDKLKWQGIDDICSFLQQNPDEFNRLDKQVRDMVFSNGS